MGTPNFQPFKLLERSTDLFLRGLPMAIGLALVCTAVQVFLVPMLVGVIFSLGGLFADLASILNGFAPIFFHVWFVLFMTGWHLRGTAEQRTARIIAARALAFAAPVAAVLALVPLGFSLANDALQVGYALDNPTANDIVYAGGLIIYSQQTSGFVMFGRQLWSGIWIAIWAAAVLSELPALIMAGRKSGPNPTLQTLIACLIAMAPWLLVVGLLGWPSQTCVHECWGLFEGGMVMIPIFGAYLFTLSASCAALSAASRVPPRPQAPLYIPPMHPFRR